MQATFTFGSVNVMVEYSEEAVAVPLVFVPRKRRSPFAPPKGTSVSALTIAQSPLFTEYSSPEIS